MRRFLLISLGAHLALALVALLWMIAPRGHDAPPAAADLPPDMTPVEVVRDPGTQASPPPTPPPAPETPPAARPEAPAPEAEGGSPPPVPPQPEQTQADAAPPSQPSPETPEVHVDLGAAGLTDEIRGEDVVSPGPDPTHQNIPPRYPRDAAMRGETGVVELLVRVSPIGTVDGVEVVRSSGHPSLDVAARDAVLRWRFIPVVRDGLAQESERVETFNFEGQEDERDQDRPGDDAGRRRR